MAESTRGALRSLKGGETTRPPLPNIGRLILAVWELFADRIVAGVRERGFEDFRLSDTRVFRNLDPEGTRITVLAERARITRQSMSELIANLEGRGYVVKRDDPTDGRAKLVHLTEKGRSVVPAAQAVYSEIVRDWGDRLGEEEYRRVHASLYEILTGEDATPRFEDPLDW